MAAEAPAKLVTVEGIPARSELPDGGALLAEADAYRVLEGGRLVHFGGLVAPQKLQLVRRKTNGSRVTFALVVDPVEGGGLAGERLEIPLDARASLAPAKLKELKHGKHVVKPEGESVRKAALNSEGRDIELAILEVKRRPAHPLLALFQRGASSVALGFANPSEAKGWFLYLSAVLGVVDEADGQTFEAMCAKQGAAGHQAHTLAALFEAAA